MALIYQGQEQGCDLYYLRIPAKVASVEGTWVPYMDLISAKSKGVTPSGLKLRSNNFGSTIRFQLHRVDSPHGPTLPTLPRQAPIMASAP